MQTPSPYLASLGPGMTRCFRLSSRATSGIRKFACLLLFVLIAAHVAHMPVLAHSTHDGVGGRVDLHQVAGGSAKGHDHEPLAATAHPGSRDVGLAGTSDHDVECMTTVATVPARSVTLDALAVPAALPDSADAHSFSLPAVLAPGSETARRHLLLQVLLR